MPGLTPVSVGGHSEGITVDADGDIWFAKNGGDPPARVGRLNPNATATEFAYPSPSPTAGRGYLGGTTPGLGTDAWARRPTTGADGNIWFAAFNGTGTSYGYHTKLISGGAGLTPVAVSATLSRLAPNTLYNYRLVASNQSGPSGPSATSAKVHHGTSVSFKLNEPAKVRFTVTLKGSFSLNGVAGKNRFHFTGRLNGRKLPPGGYRLVATPVVGGRAARPTSTAIRITR